MNHYPAGWPCWVDLWTADAAASAEFYNAVLGWELADALPGTSYRTFTLRGLRVAGVTPADAGERAVWGSYISVVDADATLAQAAARGGRVAMPAVEIPGAGRRGVLFSPDGAPLGVWEPGDLAGAELCNEPGAFCWNELNTRDSEAVIDFYPRLFNWMVRRSKSGGEYYEFHIDEHMVAGMQPMVAEHWRGVPSHWSVYFSVENLGAAMAAARAAGGAEVVPITVIPGVGRYALLSDPQGALICVLEVMSDG